MAGRHPLAGLLTAPGQGGISIVGLIGCGAAAMVDTLLQNPRDLTVAGASPGDLLYGRLVQNGQILDEVVVECATGGQREGFVINCHGGMMAARRVLNALCALGAREAPASELTARYDGAAGSNEIRREAIELIPRALTFRAVSVLLEQYNGALSAALERVSRMLENNAEPLPRETSLRQLLTTAAFGRGLVEPLRVVVAGQPNVGKSTLVNALLRFERVIVHPTAGTTRDAIEDLFSIEGVPFRIIDTAGICTSDNPIEQEGVRRCLHELEHADIALLICDGSEPLHPEDKVGSLASMPRNRISIVNKSDLPPRLDLDAVTIPGEPLPLRISAKTETGLAELEAQILAMAYHTIPERGAAVLFTARQESLARQAMAAMTRGDTEAALRLLQEIVGAGSNRELPARTWRR